jgi:hypothetical protein
MSNHPSLTALENDHVWRNRQRNRYVPWTSERYRFQRRPYLIRCRAQLERQVLATTSVDLERPLSSGYYTDCAA